VQHGNGLSLLAFFFHINFEHEKDTKPALLEEKESKIKTILFEDNAQFNISGHSRLFSIDSCYSQFLYKCTSKSGIRESLGEALQSC